METKLSDKPMFSNRDLVNLVIPLIFDALLVIAAGIVDSAMVSSAGSAAVSGVSLVDSLSLLFVSVFNAVATGGVVVTSQYIGKRDFEKAQTSAKQLIYIALIVSLSLTLILFAFYPQLLRLVYGSIDKNVFDNAKTYFFFILFGYPFLAVGNSCTALLRSMGKNRHSVLLTSGFNVLNVIGNAILIYGLKLGVAGAAISTSISRIVFAVGGLALLHNKHLPVQLEKLYKIRFDLDILKRVAIIGGGNGIEGGLFQVGKVLVASLVSSFGTVAIAANSIANSINNLGWTTIGAFSTALLPIVGQCMGAGKPDQAKTYSKKMFVVACVLMVVLFGAIFLLRKQLVLLFALKPEELEAAAYFTGAGALLTVSGLYFGAFLPMSVFRAAGDTMYAVTLSVSTMFIFRVGLSYLLGGYFKMGLIGVWIGMSADWFCRAVINFIHFKRGKWIKKKVI